MGPGAHRAGGRGRRRGRDVLGRYRRRPDRHAEVDTMNAVDVILTKRDGGTLDDAQIDWVIDAYTKGVVADEQMAALAMAILLRGMTPGEIARWTAAMIASGERLDLSTVDRPTVDKHSTGGGGGKNTLPLTPLGAGGGGAGPQRARRGPGPTRGTRGKPGAGPRLRPPLAHR